jgi:hypothetical protein
VSYVREHVEAMGSCWDRGAFGVCARFMLALWSAFPALACSGGDEPVITAREPESAFPDLARDPAFPGTRGDRAPYETLFQYGPRTADCNVRSPLDLALEVELRIFRGRGLQRNDVPEFVGALARYYAQYGIAFFTRYDVIDVPLEFALIVDRDPLAEHVLAGTGVDIRSTDASLLSDEKKEQVLSAFGRAVFHNVRELLRVYAAPRRNVINLVLLSEMLSAERDELPELANLAGFGISWELLAMFPADDPSATLYEWLDVESDFTPTAIIGIMPTQRYLTTPDVLIAHETAHAFGLPHLIQSGNLMHPAEFLCSSELSNVQLQVLHSSSLSTAGSEQFQSAPETSPRATTPSWLGLCPSLAVLVSIIARHSIASLGPNRINPDDP